MTTEENQKKLSAQHGGKLPEPKLPDPTQYLTLKQLQAVLNITNLQENRGRE